VIMEVNDRVAQKIETWKKGLLDLSMRNRLINYRSGKTSSLKVVSPSLESIFEMVAIKEKRVSFKAIPASDEGDQISDRPVELRNGEILSDREEKDMNLVLNRLRLKARTSYEEMGINTLYMAFGFLKWNEMSGAKSSLLSPLLLVPITIERESVASPYIAKMIDEEIVLNPTLCEKLEEFGLDLASTFDYYDNDSVDRSVLKRLFDEISLMISPIANWALSRDVAIGVFSFSKLSMYKDLENFERMIYENPILRTLAEGSPKNDMGDGSGDVEDLDAATDPLTSFQILDADSSQQEAILAVKSGTSLVIQGPPGTGKSQTIANVIAECMSQGKRVLFVSEKMAALEVVKRRLDSCGIGDFCLELHSKKTGKRTVLNELDRVLNEARRHAGDTSVLDAELSRLKEVRDRLNSFVRSLHLKRTKLGLSAYEVHGRLARLSKVERAGFRLPDIENIDRPRLDEILHCLDNLALHASLYRGYDRNDLHKVKARSKDAAFVMNLREELRLINISLKRLWETKENEPADEIGQYMESLSKARSETRFLIELIGTEPQEKKSVMKTLDTLRSLVDKLLEVTPAEYRRCLSDSKSLIQSVLTRYREVETEFENIRKLTGITNQMRSIDTFQDLVSSLSKYRSGLFSLDLKTLERKFGRTYRSLFGRIFGGYRKQFAILTSLKRDGQIVELELPEQVRTASRALAHYGKIATDRDDGTLMDSLETSRRAINAFRESYDRLGETLRKLEGDIKITTDRMSFISFPAGIGSRQAQNMSPRDWIGRFFVTVETFKRQLADISETVEIESVLASDSVCNFDTASSLFGRLEALIQELNDWLSLKESVGTLEKYGLGALLSSAEIRELDPKSLKDVFLKEFYSQLLADFYASDRVLNAFSKSDHNRLIEEFRALDTRQQLYARKRLASTLARRVPSRELVSSGSAETSILKREIAKKRRNKSIRRLFAETSNLIQALKPCMMMSPLSVSVFIDPEVFRFDLVVFDEASQIFPEDAIGAIMRGSQVVVVGDNRQLPPTSFFKISEPDEAELEEGEADLESLESILDECSTAGLPEKRLLWHYRSRHESLIAFSNFHFYMNRLNTFPASTFDGLDLGIAFDFVSNGVYDRSKSRKNAEEALRVATLVMDHARRKPGVSLGVVAFSEAQQTAILDQIESLRSEDLSLETFFDEDRVEPFFVKNLENVQGDERDEMFFSIGYGRDSSGKLTMNFGPLNRSGGERRLNVAITRARRKVTIVSSIKGSDISLDIATPGVRALREYLNYAEHGGSRNLLFRERQSDGDFDSPFEQEVYEELNRFGFTVHRQVGCSGYRIDLAIVDDQNPGKYLLGIECDGAMYHSARTARDRDRLRQQVLESLGWKIIRIWSRDWVFDRELEIERVLSEIERARSASPSESEENVQVVALPGIARSEFEIGTYEKFGPKDLAGRSGQRKIANMSILIDEIISKEAPVHIDEVVSRICELYETNSQELPAVSWDLYTKTGNLSRKSLRQRIMNSFSREAFMMQNDFILKRNEKVRPRRPHSAHDSRKPEHIAPLEIQGTIRIYLANAFSVSVEDLKREVARLLGYGRAGANIATIIGGGIDALVRNGEIEIADEKVRLANSK